MVLIRNILFSLCFLIASMTAAQASQWLDDLVQVKKDTKICKNKKDEKKALEACYRGARIMCKSGAFKDSLESCNLLLEQNGLSDIQKGEIYRWRADGYKISQALAKPLTTAQVKINTENYHKKIADYNKAIKLNPKDFTALGNQAYAHEGLDEKEKAISVFRKLVQLKPKDAYYHRSLATMLESVHQYGEAIGSYKNALKYETSESDKDYYKFRIGKLKKKISK